MVKNCYMSDNIALLVFWFCSYSEDVILILMFTILQIIKYLLTWILVWLVLVIGSSLNLRL